MKTKIEMKYKGFTLIELLVVVLIIGILSAIALPQYQKAVEKAKAVQAITLLRSVRDAFERYKLANGEYPTQFSDLDIEIPWTGSTKQITDHQITDTLSNEEWSLQIQKGIASGKIFVALMITRISGPYRGAMFVYSMGPYYDSLSHYPRSYELACTETISNITAHVNYVSNKPEGSYCRGIFNGTWFETSYGFSRYKMKM